VHAERGGWGQVDCTGYIYNGCNCNGYRYNGQITTDTYDD
jgi:hypothetical protein